MAAANIFGVVDRQPKIVSPPHPVKLANVAGDIRFTDVVFTYPSRPHLPVLRKFNLHVRPGQKVALVGESGCGKSTVIQLIERFYDPETGSVMVDGLDIRDLSLEQLRAVIGYVGQEPVLFATSIRENLSYGRRTATQEEMIEAL